jgi:hypothetical protein
VRKAIDFGIVEAVLEAQRVLEVGMADFAGIFSVAPGEVWERRKLM